mmetsp:Transcript_25445/g.22610  ORF Transcript_25445/g.22610 Transcript_25445/m.22610 type:complete len:389 (+) Transcript_25445:37-1203(+)
MSKWIKFSLGRPNIKGTQLILRNTVVNGQCFNWYPLQEHDYIGVLSNYLIRIKQDLDTHDIHFRYHTHLKLGKKIVVDQQVQDLLFDYFQLDSVDLGSLYKTWSKDKYFASIGPCLPGLRILRQDPWECTISFLVSQNNHIKRITTCMRIIRSTYGTKIGNLQKVLDKQEEFKDFEIDNFYTFPTLKQLSKATEKDLRDLGLGYRAKYIESSVKLIKEKGGEDWIRDLRVPTPKAEEEEVKIEESKEVKVQTDTSEVKEKSIADSLSEIREQLIELKGVGKKVADCVALFSLGCHNSIPVDTHVNQIAQRVYGKKLKSDKSYNNVVKVFNDAFGPYCGWAHSVLFAAELPKYKVIIDLDTSKKRKKKELNKLIEEDGDFTTSRKRKLK